MDIRAKEKKRMRMSYELITPAIAEKLLEGNTENRRLSIQTVEAYANDMKAGNWDEAVGAAISIDDRGILRDGQHRLAAIVKASRPVWMWVCRNVSSEGIYDNNRKRSNADQIQILRPDFDAVYRSSRYISCARVLITNIKFNVGTRPVTPNEIIDFTDEHRADLDGFFLKMPQTSVTKISLATVYTALFMAYMAGEDIDRIIEFYDILCTGMSTKPEDFPIIAYRNYLKDNTINTTTHDTIKRCQFALKKYLTGSCVKRSRVPDKLIYPFPYKSNEA